MSKRMLSYIAVIGLAFCLWPSMTWAADACSPTNITSRSSTTVLIPRVGAPQTPDSGVADGWVLVYKDSEYKQLSHEVFCQDNQIQFAASAGDKDFQENPDCTVANCTKAVGTEKVAVTGVAGRHQRIAMGPCAKQSLWPDRVHCTLHVPGRKRRAGWREPGGATHHGCFR